MTMSKDKENVVGTVGWRGWAEFMQKEIASAKALRH